LTKQPTVVCDVFWYKRNQIDIVIQGDPCITIVPAKIAIRIQQNIFAILYLIFVLHDRKKFI
jgi:hypothetical protein